MAGVELNPGPITPEREKPQLFKEKSKKNVPREKLDVLVDRMKGAAQPAQPNDKTGAKAKQSTCHDNPAFVNDGDTTDIVLTGADSPNNQTCGAIEMIEAAEYTTSDSQENIELPLLPLREKHLVEFSEYISYENQERIAVLLGFDLDKVDTLRCKHRENVTGVSLDLLLDWMRCNPQPTNRMVSNSVC